MQCKKYDTSCQHIIIQTEDSITCFFLHLLILWKQEHVEGYLELSAKTKTYFATAVALWDADFYVKVDDDVHVNIGRDQILYQFNFILETLLFFSWKKGRKRRILNVRVCLFCRR